jgi:hypothetical protein
MADDPEPTFSLDSKAVDAIADKVAKRLKPKEPDPWDTKTERRAAERRKPREPEVKVKRVGGIISYKE